jgi:hypothetical protein
MDLPSPMVMWATITVAMQIFAPAVGGLGRRAKPWRGKHPKQAACSPFDGPQPNALDPTWTPARPGSLLAPRHDGKPWNLGTPARGMSDALQNRIL